MVHLCNILGAAPWFSISDAADAECVARMPVAALVRVRDTVTVTLRPDVPVPVRGLRGYQWGGT